MCRQEGAAAAAPQVSENKGLVSVSLMATALHCSLSRFLFCVSDFELRLVVHDKPTSGGLLLLGCDRLLGCGDVVIVRGGVVAGQDSCVCIYASAPFFVALQRRAEQDPAPDLTTSPAREYETARTLFLSGITNHAVTAQPMPSTSGHVIELLHRESHCYGGCFHYSILQLNRKLCSISLRRATPVC